ncbi:hypothetical protein RHSIM_Rhsim04G0202400 [Rhododendron simsii]|uniref:Photosystem II D1 precursor processing protein PSB27-H2, chloroplastic n=1 Tax=Rhododendron simsii TaxID=118357 RepID=A0A834LRE7_RHOSS|nr:hypothetical protein RHSIM_Rhsim04G0202400 [Rhododendron simsii]
MTSTLKLIPSDFDAEDAIVGRERGGEGLHEVEEALGLIWRRHAWPWEPWRLILLRSTPPNVSCSVTLSRNIISPATCFSIYQCLISSQFNLQLPPVTFIAWAGEKAKGQDDKDEGVIEAVKSLFDPHEKTESGKVLPKAYLKSARELVRTLRDSLKEDLKDMAKFRRTADAAKESFQEYLNGWRGQNTVAKEESYVVLEKAIRSLASFYSKAGPSAPLPEKVKSEILSDLKTAEDFM